MKVVWEISDSFKAEHKNVYTDKALKEIVEKGNETDLRELISNPKKSLLKAYHRVKRRLCFRCYWLLKKREKLIL